MKDKRRPIVPLQGHRLRVLKGNLTFEKMGQIFGVHRQTVYDWMNEKSGIPSTRMLDDFPERALKMFPRYRK